MIALGLELREVLYYLDVVPSGAKGKHSALYLCSKLNKCHNRQYNCKISLFTSQALLKSHKSRLQTLDIVPVSHPEVIQTDRWTGGGT